MSDVTIRRCPSNLHRMALEMVLTDLPADQRSGVVEAVRPVASQGVDVFSTLVVAMQDQQLAGSAWIQPQVGRTATLWPPVVADPAQDELKFELAKFAVKQSQDLPVSMIQALLADIHDPVAEVLERLDFRLMAELIYLVRTVPPQVEPPDETELEFLPEPANPELLKSLTMTTYEQTLDCPGLENQRDINDTLAGYRTVGQHDPQLWSILRWRNKPVGVLLMAPYQDAPQWELVYIGIVPAARGQGLGHKVLSELDYRASRAGVEQIVLAVDAANHPALDMYDRSGYMEWSRRVAYTKQIKGEKTR